MYASSCIQHLVKSEDLNHHRTLYAGRTAEWFVETGFVAVAQLVPPDTIVCLKIHGMEFMYPVRVGDIATFQGKVVFGGRSSLVAYIDMHAGERRIVEGFITFIHVDEEGKPVPHHITIEPANAEENELYNRARSLRSQSGISK